ncbi:MAG: DUF2497 domain-containing protein [Alphaproteobacteria bacterium]
MSEHKTQEPSMEEILASIRRIISEDGAGRHDEQHDGETPAVLAGAAGEEGKHEVIELTDVVEDDGSVRRLAAAAPPAPRPDVVAADVVRHPERTPAVQAGAIENHVALISETATAESARTLAELAAVVAREEVTKGVDIPLGTSDTTISGLVTELLRPLLREWLEQNLPGLVERLVKREIEKLVRRAEGR